jgi:hypothetical protein
MRNVKRPVEKILVAKTNGSTGLAVVSDGTTELTNNTTGVTNLADGQLGVFDASGDGTNAINVAVAVGDTVTDSPKIKIAQGTPQSANPGANQIQGIFAKTYEYSDIVGDNIVAWTGKAYRAPKLNAWTIGADLGEPDAIKPLDSTEFTIQLALMGRRKDFDNSTRMVQSVHARFITPDYTTLGTANPLDHLVQNLVYAINRHSKLFKTSNSRGKEPFVAFAIDTDATTATAGSVAISAITAGTTTINGVVITADMEAAFDAIAADANVPDVDASSLIVPVDLSTAGGAVASTQAIVILGLTETEAFIDRMPFLATKLDIGLKDGFDFPTVLQVASQLADEGEGTGRQWKIYYEATDGQRAYTQNRDLYPVITPPAYVDLNESYTAYIIQHNDVHDFGLDSDLRSPMKTIILVPSSDTTTQAQLKAVLNPYINSGARHLPPVTA